MYFCPAGRITVEYYNRLSARIVIEMRENREEGENPSRNRRRKRGIVLLSHWNFSGKG
jgi:hypothetical protein